MGEVKDEIDAIYETREVPAEVEVEAIATFENSNKEMLYEYDFSSLENILLGKSILGKTF